MQPQCIGTRTDGKPCRTPSLPDSVYCFGHDPTRAEQRQAGRVAGGKNRSTTARAMKRMPPHLLTLQTRLLSLIDKLEAGDLDAKTGEAIARIAAQIIDLARFALETAESDALKERIQTLEAELKVLAS